MFFIDITEVAKDKVTQRGRPSGTATTIRVIEIKMKSMMSFKVSIYSSLPSGFMETAMTKLTNMAINVAIDE